MTDDADRPVMLVAGGSGSIGQAVAREAADQGWAVIVHGRSSDKVSAVVTALRPAVPAEGVVAGIGLDDDAAAIVEAAVGKFGRIDAVVDCVSTGPREGRIIGLFKDTTPPRYTDFHHLSTSWFQRLAHAAYPHLEKRGGTLIAFVSDAGRFAAPNQTIVGAARAGAIGFVRNLAVEAARDGIRVHAISPSYVLESRSAGMIGKTRIDKAAARAGLGLPTAADIAPITVFLCGDGAARITGQIISVNGGLQA